MGILSLQSVSSRRAGTTSPDLGTVPSSAATWEPSGETVMSLKVDCGEHHSAAVAKHLCRTQGPKNSAGKGRGWAGRGQETADAPDRIGGQQGSGPGSRHFCFPSETLLLLGHIKSSPQPGSPRKNRTHIVLPY